MENKMNQSKQKRILLRAVIIVVCLAGYIMLVRVLNSVEKTEMFSMKGYSYQKAVVTEVVRDNLTEDGQRAGYQYLKVKLLTGFHRKNLCIFLLPPSPSLVVFRFNRLIFCVFYFTKKFKGIFRFYIDTSAFYVVNSHTLKQKCKTV